MWQSPQTRPDISSAVRAVATYLAAPKLIHWKTALVLLGCVRRMSSFGITLQRGTVGGLSLQVYADADYASKAADRRSVSAGLVMCGDACVSWFSRIQKCVTLSTTADRVRGACGRCEGGASSEAGLAFRFARCRLAIHASRSWRMLRVLCSSRRAPLSTAARSTSTYDTTFSGN